MASRGGGTGWPLVKDTPSLVSSPYIVRSMMMMTLTTQFPLHTHTRKAAFSSAHQHKEKEEEEEKQARRVRVFGRALRLSCLDQPA